MEINSKQKKWNVLYSEHEWTNPPSEKPEFENNTDEFRIILAPMKELAIKLECDNFADRFSSATDLLDGSSEYPDQKHGLELSQIPRENLQIFEAAGIADVFGTMGSWNDSPAWAARNMNLEEEYDCLSDELLKNIRLVALYAINEW